VRAALVAGAIASLFVAAPARADEDDERPEVVKMRFVERGAQLHVTTKIGKLFDRAAYEALDSGFTSTIVIRMWSTARLHGSDRVQPRQPPGALQPVGRGLRAAVRRSDRHQGLQGEAQGRGADPADQPR